MNFSINKLGNEVYTVAHNVVETVSSAVRVVVEATERAVDGILFRERPGRVEVMMRELRDEERGEGDLPFMNVERVIEGIKI